MPLLCIFVDGPLTGLRRSLNADVAPVWIDYVGHRYLNINGDDGEHRYVYQLPPQYAEAGISVAADLADGAQR